MGFHVFGAEHANGALELETRQRKIESEDEEEARFGKDELGYEDGDGGERERNHDAQGRSVALVAQDFMAQAVDEVVVGT